VAADGSPALYLIEFADDRPMIRYRHPGHTDEFHAHVGKQRRIPGTGWPDRRPILRCPTLAPIPRLERPEGRNPGRHADFARYVARDLRRAAAVSDLNYLALDRAPPRNWCVWTATS